jgi:hypothetical protein
MREKVERYTSQNSVSSIASLSNTHKRLKFKSGISFRESTCSNQEQVTSSGINEVRFLKT